MELDYFIDFSDFDPDLFSSCTTRDYRLYLGHCFIQCEKWREI